MYNIPEVKLGLVAVSRDCFPITLSKSRRENVYKCCGSKKIAITEIQTIIENEADVLKALEEIKQAGVNALVVYLGNFGPEGPETMLAQRAGIPCMFVAAAEETIEGLADARGDAYCGLLNASYNLNLRGLKAYIPEKPVGTPDEIADRIADFIPIARIIIGVKNLKILAYGPRPHDFLACNAPIAPLYDLGVEVMENSELDLYLDFIAHENDKRIPEVAAEMAKELGDGCCYGGFLPKLAQYELTLLDQYEKNLGGSKYAVFANKCWPAFQNSFGFVPCYVNSRMSEKGIPVACETDIYGALTQFILACATLQSTTLLDINNTVPAEMHSKNYSAFRGYQASDIFMGFHCGNTTSSKMKSCSLKYQLIMKRLIEPNDEPNKTVGTLEGAIAPGDITLFRLQGNARGKLQSYVAHGEVIDVDPQSFGGIGIIAVREMQRFYRHVLVEKNYPHHAGVGFAPAGKSLFEAMKLLGVADIAYNKPANILYDTENPFA